MATMKKAQDGNFIRKGMSAMKGFKKPAPKMVPGEMTGKMYKKSEIDAIGDKQAAELDKSGVFGKAAMAKKKAPKAQSGDLISKYGLKPKNLNDRQLNRVSKISEKNVERSKKVANRISERRNTRGAESAKNPLYFKNGGKEMIKRADGSYSQRGLWDNIRAAKGSGKKPTAAMLKQEKKIKAKTKK
jgi:hypothetical protein